MDSMRSDPHAQELGGGGRTFSGHARAPERNRDPLRDRRFGNGYAVDFAGLPCDGSIGPSSGQLRDGRRANTNLVFARRATHLGLAGKSRGWMRAHLSSTKASAGRRPEVFPHRGSKLLQSGPGLSPDRPPAQVSPIASRVKLCLRALRSSNNGPTRAFRRRPNARVGPSVQPVDRCGSGARGWRRNLQTPYVPGPAGCPRDTRDVPN